MITKGYMVSQGPSKEKVKRKNAKEDRTGRLTIHPELLDQDGQITEEELLTVRFSGEIDPPRSAETSAE